MLFADRHSLGAGSAPATVDVNPSFALATPRREEVRVIFHNQIVFAVAHSYHLIDQLKFHLTINL